MYAMHLASCCRVGILLILVLEWRTVSRKQTASCGAGVAADRGTRPAGPTRMHGGFCRDTCMPACAGVRACLVRTMHGPTGWPDRVARHSLLRMTGRRGGNMRRSRWVAATLPRLVSAPAALLSCLAASESASARDPVDWTRAPTCTELVPRASLILSPP